MGNPTSYDGTALTWAGKQLQGAGTTTFSYDENGLRTRKTVNGTATDYYYNGSVLMGMKSGSTVQSFSYDSAGNVVSVNYAGTEYYYLRNGQGDIVKLIDGSRNTAVEYIYDTWGKVLSCTGTLASSLGAKQPFRYRGYVYDTETGWYYLQSRYYDPETNRFISADVMLSTGQGELGHNSFVYCLNNPVNMSDPSGLSSFWDGLKDALAIVAVVAAVVAVVAVVVVATVATGGGALVLASGGIAAATSVASTVATVSTATAIASTTTIVGIEVGQVIAYGIPNYPGDDPNKSPGDEWEWRGKGNPETGRGNYTNPNTGESLHPDLSHPLPVGPHWDYKDMFDNWWRIFPDNSILPK